MVLRENQMTVHTSTAFSKSKADAISENILVKKKKKKKKRNLVGKHDVVPITSLIFIGCNWINKK